MSMCRQAVFPRVPLAALDGDLLASVGPLLCLYPQAWRSELAAWQGARDVCAESCVDDDGARESLRFLDQAGRSCMRLFLLPDSDYRHWEALRARLPCVASERRADICRPCVALRRCFEGWLGGGSWSASFLRVEPARKGEGAALGWTAVSGIGRDIARRIARAEGVVLPSGC